MVECQTAADAAVVVKELEANHTSSPTLLAMLTAIEVGPWNNKLFWDFMGSLGDSQKRILALLVKNQRVSAEDLRKALGVDNNNQLSGLLSGISKQAAAHDVHARAVYTIQDETRSGETTKTYVAAPEFLRIAWANNWTGDEV